MRHLQRTHDVSVKWLSDSFRSLHPRLTLINCDTKDQSADIFTKAFDSNDKWRHACDLIGFGGHHPLTSTRIPKEPKNTTGKAGAARPALIEPLHSRRCRCLGCASSRAERDNTKSTGIDRVIIEFCCYEDSLMGRSIPQSQGCHVIRVTSAHDMTTEKGLLWLVGAIRQIPKHIPVLSWRCGCKAEVVHAKASGGNTEMTGKYIPLFVAAVHTMFTETVAHNRLHGSK